MSHAARTHLFRFINTENGRIVPPFCLSQLRCSFHSENPQNASLGKSQWQCFSFSWFNNATAGDTVKSIFFLFVRLKKSRQTFPSSPFSLIPPSLICPSPIPPSPLLISLIIAAQTTNAAFRKDRYRDRQSLKAYSNDNYWRTVLSKD